jgi:hypothetical protein
MPEKASASLRKDAIHPQVKNPGFSGMSYNDARMFLLFSSNHHLDLLGIPFVGPDLEGKGDRDERD